MVFGSLLTRLYVAIISVISLVSLIYVYAVPPNSLAVDRDGVPHFTPPVAHPETGKSLPLADLIRHYRGD
ncbi:MAG: hypothetical protein ACR2PO_00760 [Methyloligellaceae bacterium]